MPILETVAYVIVVSAFLPQAVKEFCGLLMRTECWIRCIARNSLDSVPEDLIRYDQNEVNDVVLNDSVDRITSVLKKINYGVLIISAPTGSGKSTYLMKALEKMTPKKRMKIFIGGEYLQDLKMILSSFGIPGYGKLSKYLSKGSIIIIDQVDFTIDAFNNTIQRNITDLATDSHNSKNYLVILCLSDAQFALKALKCNGGLKINLAVSPAELKWTENEAIAFLRMKGIPEDRTGAHLELFAPCYNPYIIRDYFKMGWMDDAIREQTKMKQKQWEDFANNITTDVCERYLVPVPP